MIPLASFVVGIKPQVYVRAVFTPSYCREFRLKGACLTPFLCGARIIIGIETES